MLETNAWTTGTGFFPRLDVVSVFTFRGGGQVAVLSVEVEVADGPRRARLPHDKLHPGVDPPRVDHEPILSDVGVDGKPETNERSQFISSSTKRQRSQLKTCLAFLGANLNDLFGESRGEYHRELLPTTCPKPMTSPTAGLI